MSSSSPNIAQIREQMEKVANQAMRAATEIDKDAIRQQMETAANQASAAASAIERDLEYSLAMAQHKYQQDRKAWKAYLLLQKVKGGSMKVAKTAVDHFTVIGSVILEIPGLRSTMNHIDRLRKIENMVGCHCGEKESKLPKQHCKDVLLPYVLEQKMRKFDHKTIGVLPVIGTIQTVTDTAHAVEKEVDGTLHQIREQRAKELMRACKEGCLMANAIGAELLGWFSDIASQTKLQAYKEDSEGWRYLYRKMGPK